MKFPRYYICFILFFAVFLTIGKSLPCGEESVAKTEMAKKAGETSEEDVADEDDQDDDLEEYCAPEILDWSDLYIDPYLYNYTSHKYLCSYQDKTTPPPKV